MLTFEGVALILGSDTPLTITVALVAALGAAGIGALAVVYVNRRQMEFERRQRMLERQLAAVDDFIKAVATVMLVMNQNRPSAVDAAGSSNVLDAGVRLMASRHRIEILFGSDSDIAAAALETHLSFGSIATVIIPKEQKDREAQLGNSEVFLGKFKMAVMAYLADSSEKTRTDRPAKRS